MNRNFCRIAIVMLLTVCAGFFTQASSLPTNAPARIELRDQFDAPQILIFPSTNVTVLTIADRRGSEQISAWVIGIKKRFANQVDIRGLADVSAVPRPLHSLVRKKFQHVQSYPVMMDWTGTEVKRFRYTAGKANLLVIDHHGQIVRRYCGEATPALIQDLSASLDLLISGKPANN